MYDYFTVFSCYLAIIAGAHRKGPGAAGCAVPASMYFFAATVHATPDLFLRCWGGPQHCLSPVSHAAVFRPLLPTGLGCTLLWLAMARKALPALPVSIALGVSLYFISRFVMEPVILPMTLELVYF